MLEKKPDIIQFVGHGIYKDDKGQIALMDDLGDSWLVDEQAFANLFQGSRRQSRIDLPHRL